MNGYNYPNTVNNPYTTQPSPVYPQQQSGAVQYGTAGAQAPSQPSAGGGNVPGGSAANPPVFHGQVGVYPAPTGYPSAPSVPATHTAEQKTVFFHNWKVLHTSAIVLAAIASAIMFLVPELPLLVVAGIGAGVGMLLAITLVAVARPKILYSLGTVGLSFVLAAAGSGAVWFLTHPQVHVDNASSEPVQIWLDGKKALQINANSHRALRVHVGDHKFGWSPKGASKPQHSVKGPVSMLKGHLYNPGKTASYWLVVDTYGNSSGAGKSWGPQPIKEYYQFDSVDTWFGDNPEMVKVKRGQKGKVKTAVQRAKIGMKFAKCSLEVRQDLVQCQRTAVHADDERAFAACSEQAVKSCRISATRLTTAKPKKTGVLASR